VSQARDYAISKSLNRDLLVPLIFRTFENVIGNADIDLQTGPAKRGDLPAIERHLKLLETDPFLRELYEFLSLKIMTHYKAGK
jgi:predicted short-subunit dehydrogenase-like oxidoreductase (DUF2520 family)